MKGMILAAGMGTRLRPLVGQFPKPLAPVLNTPMLLYNLLLLRKAGIREVVINLHYGTNRIIRALGDGSQYGLHLAYAREEKLLGTGGGIRNVRDFFGGETFVVANGDTIVDVDLKEAIQRHRERRALATMMLMDDPRADAFGAVRCDEDHQVRSIGELTASSRPVDISLPGRVFAGIHIIEPGVLDLIPPHDGAPICIVRTAYRAMMEGRVSLLGDPSCRFWCDAGTPERYLQANLTLLARPDLCPHVERKGPDQILTEQDCRVIPPVLIGNGCRIGRGATIGPLTILGANVTVEPNVSVRRSVVWGGQVVRESLEDAVKV